MTFNLTNNPSLNPRGPATPEPLTRNEREAKADLARSQLLDLKQHVETRAAGSRFPGYLRIHNLSKALEDSSTPLVVKRSWGLREMFQPTRRMVDSTHYFRNAIIVAYKDRLAPEDYQALMKKMDRYLADRLFLGFGSRHFTRFIAKFENAAERYGRDGAIVPLDSETGRLLATRRIKGMGKADVLPADMARKANRVGVAALTGVKPSEVKVLGTGAEGTAFKADRGGEPVVVKLAAGPQDLDTALMSGDVAACRMQSAMPHVATPTAFIVEVLKDGETKGPVYRVPAPELSGMVKKALVDPLGRERRVRLLGTEAPYAAGAPLTDAMKQRPLNDQEALSLARGMALGMEEMRANGLVHQDIKPDNVMLDRSTGRVHLIDVSAQTQLSREAGGQLLSRSVVGSPPYQSPLARDPALGHGFEADRYSFAVTLLAGLEPHIDDINTHRKLSPYLQPANPLQKDAEGRPIPAAAVPAQRYLDAFLDALQEADPARAVALRARIEPGSPLREILEDAFLASQPGEVGHDAWVRVLERLGAQLSGSDAIEHVRALAKAIVNPSRPTLNNLMRSAAVREGFPAALDYGTILDVADVNGNTRGTELRSKIEAAVRAPAIQQPVTQAVVNAIAAKVVNEFVSGKKASLDLIAGSNLPESARVALQRHALESSVSKKDLQKMIQVLKGPMLDALRALGEGDADRAIRGLANSLRQAVADGLTGVESGGALFATVRIAHEIAFPRGSAMSPNAWRALTDRAPLMAAVKQAGEHLDPDDNRFFSGSGLRGAALRDVSGQMTGFGMLLNAVLEVVDETSPTGDDGAVEAWRSLPSVAANSQVLDEIADLLGMDLPAMRAQA